MRTGNLERPAGRTGRAWFLAFALLIGVAPFISPVPALAEDNNPNPPPPKPKDPPPPPDPCRNDKMKSACRNAEAVRALLREAPPMDPEPAVPHQGSGASSASGG